MADDSVVKLREHTEENPHWPIPVGWRILVDPVSVKTISEGGILLSSETQMAERYQNYIGRVVALGPLCYKHAKFGDGGPWCKVGDWIAYGQHAGQTVNVRNTQVLDAIGRLDEEIREKALLSEELTKKVPLAIGIPDNLNELNSKRDKLNEEIAALHLQIASFTDESERRLRLLNDDEILAVIPNKDVIRTYI